MNFLKFKDEKQTFSKVQGPKQYFTSFFFFFKLWTFVFYKQTSGMYFAFQIQPYVYFFFVFNIWERIKLDWSNLNAQGIYKSSVWAILLFKGFFLFGFLIFYFKNAPTPLCLSRNKTKRQSSKNATLTPTTTLPKKQDHSYFSK